MLINPYVRQPAVIPGTRLLDDALDGIGFSVIEPREPKRLWTIQGFYAPVYGRALGGIRARLQDQKGFISFCNQRDLEVLLGIATPGTPCPWSDEDYVGADDRSWYGLCCDDEDLRDDLQEQEMFARARLPGGILVPNLELTRRVHLSYGSDYEEEYYVLEDMDPETGMFPDLRFETIDRRWMRSERRRVRWDRS